MNKYFEAVRLNLRLHDGEIAAAPAPVTTPATTSNSPAATAQVTGEPGRKPLIHPRRQAEMDKAAATQAQTGGTVQATAAPAAPVDTKVASVPTKDVAQDHDAAFDALINGDYKEQYDKRVKAAIDRRFKENSQREAQTKDTETKLGKAQAVLDMLGAIHGVDSSDADAISKAIENDEHYWADIAMEKGITAQAAKEQFKREADNKRLLRENAQLVESINAEKRQKQTDALYTDWLAQAEKVKTEYQDST
jgi:hypothetical protein